MDNTVNPVGRWAIIGALLITALMIAYYLFSGNGTVAFGMSVIALALAAFVYLFYARLNSVQRSGYMALLFVILIALLLPFLFLNSAQSNAQAAKAQYDSQLSYAAGKYITYCSQCHGLLGQGLTGAQLVNNKDLEKINVQAVITTGIVDSSSPATYLMPAWGDQYGGPFNADDIAAMTNFVQSWDPVLTVKNNVPDPNLNGFSLIFAQLTTPTQQADYLTQQAQAAQVAAGHLPDPPADLTALKQVTVPIVADPNLTHGASWNFLYTSATVTTPTRVITVKAGTQVRWMNTSGLAHSIYSGTPGNNTNVFSFALVSNGTTTSYVTLNTPGTYNYYCSFHPAMIAQIVVVP